MRALAVFSWVLTMLTLAACSLLVDTSGLAGDAAPGRGLAGDAAPGCQDRTVYVSVSGDDAATGCDRTRPKRTLTSAIAIVKRLGVADHDVHACAGTYDEPELTIDVPLAVRGGYDCASWQRADKTSGAETIVRPSIQENARTLRVAPEAPVDVTLDTLTLLGPTRSPARAVTVQVGGKARVTMTRCRIVGGSGTTGTDAVKVNGGSLEVQGSSIEGGDATEQTPVGTVDPASAALNCAGTSELRVNESVIDGGSGTQKSATATVDVMTIRIADACAATIADSQIRFGGGGAASFQTAAEAVRVIGGGPKPHAPVELRGNFIERGKRSTCPAGQQCQTTGIYVAYRDGVRIVGNRVYGGDVGASGTKHRATAIGLVEAFGTTIANNVILAGGAAGATPDERGVSMAGGGDNAVVHNTIVLATPPNLDPGGLTLIGIEVASPRAVVQKNLIAQLDSGFALVYHCAAPGLKFESNALVQRGNGFSLSHSFGGACGTPGLTTSLRETESVVLTKGAAAAANNVLLRGYCVASPEADTACREVVDCREATSACFESIFDAWSGKSLGYDEYVTSRFKLRTGSSCRLRGGLDLTATVPTDAFGAARTAPTSMGAHEDDSMCTP